MSTVKKTSVKKAASSKKPAVKKASAKKAPLKKPAAAKKTAVRKTAAKKAAPLKKAEDSPVIALGRKCVALIDEKKGENTSFLDLRDVNSYLDFFIITTASSKTQCRALAKDIEGFFIQQGMKPKSHPDYESEWVIIDYFGLVIHVFTQEMRAHYDLDRLWADAERL
ncbi:MAG: ribosome silencing factor [Spirochaetota bacterium]